jgi:hypothetical protein
MSLPKHIEEAVERLKQASYRIDEARAKPAGLEATNEWLSALTDYATSLCDIHLLNNESIHEKLHEIAERVKLKL